MLNIKLPLLLALLPLVARADFTIDQVFGGSVEDCTPDGRCDDAYDNAYYACPASDEGCVCYDNGFSDNSGTTVGDYDPSVESLPSFFSIDGICDSGQLNFYQNGDTYNVYYNGGDGTIISTCSQSGGGSHYCWDVVGSTSGSRLWYCPSSVCQGQTASHKRSAGSTIPNVKRAAIKPIPSLSGNLFVGLRTADPIDDFYTTPGTYAVGWLTNTTDNPSECQYRVTTSISYLESEVKGETGAYSPNTLFGDENAPICSFFASKMPFTIQLVGGYNVTVNKCQDNNMYIDFVGVTTLKNVIGSPTGALSCSYNDERIKQLSQFQFDVSGAI